WSLDARRTLDAFESRKLNDTEQKYTVQEKEMTTIIHCLKKVYKLGKMNVADDALSRKADDELGDEGLFSGRTKLNSIFITAEVTFIQLKQPTSGDKGHGNGNPWGSYQTSLTNAKNPSLSPAFIKENIDILRTMIKEHDQQAKMKATLRKLAYADSDKEAPAGSLAKGFFDRFSLGFSGTSDTHRQTRSTIKRQKTPSKNKELAHLRRSKRLEDQSTSKERARRERSKPKRKRVYERNKDPEDHLGIFSAAAEQEEWLMPIWCKMFRQTLGGAAQNWFDDLDPKSVDSFEELSQKFLEEFSQQKDMLKTPQKFMASKDGRMRICKLSWPGSEPSLEDKWPLGQQKWSVLLKGTKDTFVRHGPEDLKEPETEADQGKHKGIGGVHSLSQKIYFHPAYQDSERNPRHGNRHNTNDCYQLKNQIEEVVALGKLAHLVKDIRRNNQRNGNQGRNGVKVINMIREEGNHKRPFEEGRFGMMNEHEPILLEGIIKGNQVQRILVDGGSSSEIMYEHCFRNLDVNIRSKLRRGKAPMIGFLGETYNPLGVTDLRVTMGREGRSKTVLMEFAIIKCHSSYNVIIGRAGMRNLGAVGSTIHSMIKFLTNQGVITMKTSREALRECKHLERV
ncbi:hypothetical protein Tco_0424477, partial [Tanacetum coccineum]